MAITIESIREAKQQAKNLGKPVKFSVGDGIRLNISKSSAVFQLRYRIKDAGKNKERTLTLDKLTARTDITLTKSLNKAIDDAEIAKALVKQGIDLKSGLLTRTTDKLNIKTFENIELVKTPMARLHSPFWKSYGTLNLYAYGGTVIMPYLKEPEKMQK